MEGFFAPAPIDPALLEFLDRLNREAEEALMLVVGMPASLLTSADSSRAMIEAHEEMMAARFGR